MVDGIPKQPGRLPPATPYNQIRHTQFRNRSGGRWRCLDENQEQEQEAGENTHRCKIERIQYFVIVIVKATVIVTVSVTVGLIVIVHFKLLQRSLSIELSRGNQCTHVRLVKT